MEVAKRRANIVLQIEWILFSIKTMLAMLIVVVYSKDIKTSGTVYEKGSTTTTTYRWEGSRYSGILLIIAVAVLIPLALNILLSVGVRKENRTCCIFWYIIAILGILLHALIFVIILISGGIISIVIEGVWLAYKIYAVVIIINFTSAVELHKNSTPGVIYMAPGSAAPGPGQVGFGYENPNPPPYDDSTKIPPPWNNSHNPDYPGAVGV